jgi:hypothetical protein
MYIIRVDGNKIAVKADTMKEAITEVETNWVGRKLFGGYYHNVSIERITCFADISSEYDGE